jgi:CheY-like chemotaxis protein
MTNQSPFILYVEDDPSNRKVMSLLMEKVMGIKSYAIFEDSDRFMERLAALPSVPDIVLLDIHLKPHDGFELLRMLRASTFYKSAKIIALTASVMNEEVEKLRSSGFNGAISKPINLSTFPELIKHVINGESVWSIS